MNCALPAIVKSLVSEPPCCLIRDILSQPHTLAVNYVPGISNLYHRDVYYLTRFHLQLMLTYYFTMIYLIILAIPSTKDVIIFLVIFLYSRYIYSRYTYYHIRIPQCNLALRITTHVLDILQQLASCGCTSHSLSIVDYYRFAKLGYSK